MKLIRRQDGTKFVLTFEITIKDLDRLGLLGKFAKVWSKNNSRQEYVEILRRYLIKEQELRHTEPDPLTAAFRAAQQRAGYSGTTFQSQYENAQRILRDEPPPIPEPAWCKILGLPRTATQDEIKKSYRSLAHQHHPDKGGDPVRFNQINQAYNEATKGQS